MSGDKTVKTTGKRPGLWERLADGLRGARTGFMAGTTAARAASDSHHPHPIPQPTTELAQRAFSRFGVDPTFLSRDELVTALAEGLEGTWHCTRSWEAWHVGTMTSRDFSPLSESDCPDELADTLIAMMPAHNGWRPIDTAPVATTDYFFCDVCWGPEDDPSTGPGMRFRGQWWAAAVVHVLRSDHDTPRFEFVTRKVDPKWWRPDSRYTPYEVVE